LPKYPADDSYARATLLIHKPWSADSPLSGDGRWKEFTGAEGYPNGFADTVIGAYYGSLFWEIFIQGFGFRCCPEYT